MVIRFFIKLCLGIIFCTTAGLALAQQTVTPEANRDRPSIFINQKRLNDLGRLAESQNPWWSNIFVWSRRPERNQALVADGPGLALTHILMKHHGNKLMAAEQGKLAKACALKTVAMELPADIFKASDIISQTALTLDWAWSAFSQAERLALGKWLVRQANSFSQKEYSPFSSEHAAQLKIMTLAGLAAEGLDSGAETLQKQALEVKYQKLLLPCLSNLGKGGAWFEDDTAGSRAGLHILESVAAFKTAKGVDLTSGVEWYKDRILKLVFTALPRYQRADDLNYFPVAPGGDRSLDPVLAADYLRLQLNMLLALLPDAPYAGWGQAWLMHSRRPATINRHLRALEFIWLQPYKRQELLAKAPLLWHSQDTGRVYLRSDWSDRATWIKFSAGSHFSARQHLDAGAVQLFKDETLLAPGGAYDGPLTPHALNYAVRSIAQNTIRIMDPDEYSWQLMRAGKMPDGTYVNDGGQKAFCSYASDSSLKQAAPWTATGWMTGEYPYNELNRLYNHGGITHTESQRRYQYACADITAAYQGNTNKARRVVRHLVHLLPGGPQEPTSVNVVLLIDDIVLNRPRSQVRFVAHLPGKPSLPGEIKQVGPGRYLGKTGKLLYQGRVMNLHIISVLPTEPLTYIFGGLNKAAAWVDGQNYAPQGKVDYLADWRVEIGSAQAKGDLRPMVTALVPVGMDETSILSMDPLDTAQKDLAGVVVRDKTWPRVVAVKLGGPLKTGQLAYKYPHGRSRHLVVGLEPKTSYEVKVDSGQITITKGKGLISSPAGLLAFVLEPQPADSKKEEGQPQ